MKMVLSSKDYSRVATASLVLFVIGIALLLVTPFLSLLNLVGIVLLSAVPGAVFGYVRNRWGGFVEWGVWSGVAGFVVLYLILASGVVPEKKPPPLPEKEQTTNAHPES